MARVRTPKAGPKVYAKALIVEVPRAALEDAAQASWPDVVTMAGAAGWRVRDTDDYLWCAKDHALLREGHDEMRGIPVLLYQNW